MVNLAYQDFTLLTSFNGLLSRTTWVSRHQKVKPIWILMEQKTTGWQWHQLVHMKIIYTSLRTDNHASISSPPAPPPSYYSRGTVDKCTVYSGIFRRNFPRKNNIPQKDRECSLETFSYHFTGKCSGISLKNPVKVKLGRLPTGQASRAVSCHRPHVCQSRQCPSAFATTPN